MRTTLAILLIGLMMPASRHFMASDNEVILSVPEPPGFRFDDIVQQFELLPGDIVFRRGKGVISDILSRVASKDARFSHSGIIISTDPEILVVHVMGAGGSGRHEFRTEQLSDFLSAQNAGQFSICRIDMSGSERERIEPYFTAKRIQDIVFDDEFDLDSDDEQYCSELIYKCITSVTGNPEVISVSEKSGRRYISFDDLANNAQPLISYVYN